MKRFRELLCVMLSVALLLSGCQTEEKPEVSSDPASDIPDAGPVLTELYPDPSPAELPSAISLSGSRHFPPLTSQGYTNACAAYATTYYQFSTAVSTYMEAIGVEGWETRSGNRDRIFSPRFTFLRGGKSIGNCYRALSQYGGMPISHCDFAMQNCIPYLKMNDVPIAESVAWSVTKLEAQLPLFYRLTGHKTLFLDDTPFDDALLLKMKTALAVGNCIILSTETSGWRYQFIDRDGCGTFGKMGDQAVFAASEPPKNPMNHAITIIGYDDGITCTVNGNTLHGAFLAANSNGDTWKNGGYIWIMYDAMRERSEFEGLSDTDLYRNDLYLTNKQFGKLTYLDSDTRIVFTKTGETYQGDQEFLKGYPLYTIQNDAGYYLSALYAPGMKYEIEMEWQKTGAVFERYILLPASEIHNLPEFDYPRPIDDGAYFILDTVDGTTLRAVCSIFSNINHSPIQCAPLDLLSDYSVYYSVHPLLFIPGFREDLPAFDSMVSLYNPYEEGLARVPLGTRLDFTDWRTDIDTGLPHRWIEFTVSASDRGVIRAELQNSKSKKAVILQGMSGKPVAIEQPLLFSGIAPKETDTENGVFAVCLDGLTGNGNWTLTVSGDHVNLLLAKLMDEKQRVLSEVIPEDGKTAVFPAK